MRTKRLLVVALTASLLLLAITAYAQVRRTYRPGSVWTVAFIKMKPGMETAYLNYIATDWKKEQEALKKDGQTLSYKVLTSEPHNPGDFNIMLMTEYKDLATMEANDKKADDLAQKVVGNDETQMAGYRKRLEIREVLGDRLAREMVLEPRP
jgi:hypothetical protein